jgi:hypothetical protein
VTRVVSAHHLESPRRPIQAGDWRPQAADQRKTDRHRSYSLQPVFRDAGRPREALEEDPPEFPKEEVIPFYDDCEPFFDEVAVG